MRMPDPCSLNRRNHVIDCLGTLILVSIISASPGFSEELSIEYTTIARSGVTSIPENAGVFANFGSAPAIDADGNVVLVASGNGQAGVYTFIDEAFHSVADRNTAIPGRGGTTFDGFNWVEVDIDGGRVAFKSASTTPVGIYSNVGRASPGDLAEVVVFDGIEWSDGKSPWVDGDVVAMKGQRLIPQTHQAILLWNGSDLSEDFVDQGNGYNVGYHPHASISGNAALLMRGVTGDWELAIAEGGGHETLADFGVTPMPGLGGITFETVNKYPVVDRRGLDAAFLGYGGQKVGVYKRVDGGALARVTDSTMPIPGGADQFKLFAEDGLALANGKVAFKGQGQGLLDGIYTDVGGELAVILDDRNNDTILLDGQPEQILAAAMGNKSFAFTPNGYELVFKAYFATGGTAIIRATINGEPRDPGQGINLFTVFKDFSDNNSASVSVNLSCTSGTVSNNPQWASEQEAAIFAIEDAAPGATCTAVESVPAGYTANQIDCQDGDPLDGSCTIVNNLIPPSVDSFTVYKDFSDNNSGSVSVSLSCTSGTVTNNPQLAREGAPAVFSISGASSNTSCTAVENSVPSGYKADQTDCQNGDRLNNSCTIINNRIASDPDAIMASGFE